jgi:predicted RND superfamily exporter protein
VMLTGCTLAAAVGTWAFSPIQFQADMGELLAFMFLWNMLGALGHRLINRIQIRADASLTRAR